MGHASVRVRGRLTIGSNEFEVSSAAVSYELNNIPQAQFAIAVGRGKGTLTPAAIHRLGGSLQPEQPVQFFCTLKVLETTEPYSLPGGEFLLFDGYLTGVSTQKMRGSLTAIVHARNWLLDMDYSSALSEMSHPINPSQFSYRANHTFAGAGGVAWLPTTDKGPIDATTLASDFWGKGMLPWLQALTSLDQINKVELGFATGPESTKNDTAAKALGRFTTKAGNYVPLALDFKNADADSIAKAIWNDVQLTCYDSTLANTTLWGKLINDYASRFMFAVVPRVSDALVVPYIPGLNTTWKASITGKDYEIISATSELQRRLRACGIMCGLMSRTGSGQPGKLGIGGYYAPSGVTKGMIMIKQGPRWLTNITAADRYSPASTGAGVKPIGNAMHPGAANAGGISKLSQVPPPDTLKAQSKTILDAFAKSLYVYELLRLRQLEVSCKARFDIGPGSTIRLEASADKFIPGDALAAPMLGDVVRVTHLVDCERPAIATNYNVAHVRTEYENGLPGYTVTQHPLWKNPWTGCGMLATYD